MQPAALELLEALSTVLDRAGRPKDIEDARSLWRLHGSRIDRHRILRVLQLLEEALGQSDLLSGFESIAMEHSND